MSYLKDREIWLSNVPTGNPPAGYFWKFIQNGKVVVRDSSGNNQMMIATSGSQAITGSLTVTEGITGTVSTASYVEYSGVGNKPTLVSGSSQITYSGLTGIPSGIVSGSSQVTFLGLSSIPSGIVSGSGQVLNYGIFATTGSNGFNGSQSITGSLTVTGQVIAQTLNVQQVTSSIVYSSGSNIFGNTVSNVQSFTGSLQVSGSSHYLIGNVGVNTSTPTNGKLEVQQTSGTPALWIQTAGVTSEFCVASFRTGTNLPALEIYGNGNSTFGGTSCFQSGVCVNHTVKPQLTINGSTGAGAALSFQTQLGNSTCNRNWAFVTEDNLAGDFVLKVSCQQYCNPVSFGTTVMQFNRCGWMTIGSTAEEALLTVDALNKNISAIRVKAECGAQAISIAGTGEFKVDAPGVGGGRFIIRDNCFVGIGCSTPSYVLDVRDGTTGSAGGRGMRLSTCSNSAGPQFRFEYQCTGNARNWLIGTNQEVAGDFIIRNSTIAGCDPGGSSSTTRFSISKDGAFGFNCLGVAARTMVVKGATGCYIVAEFIEPAGVHSIEIYPNKSSTNHISSDYMSGGTFLPLSLSGRENVNDLVLTTDGRAWFQCQLTVGAVATAGIHTLDVQIAGGACVISGNPGTACAQNMSGIRVYNTASGTSNSMTGVWFHTGPHLAGIASGRCDAAAGWGNDLRFYVHYQTTDTLDNSYEKMRLNPEGVLTLFGYGAGTLSTNSAGVISASDGRLKTKTRTIENGLCSVMQLQPTYYRWNECTAFHTEYEELGFIAQEVACVIPAASPEPEEERKFKNYSDRAVIAMLTKGMQEQQTLIESLKSRIEILEQ